MDNDSIRCAIIGYGPRYTWGAVHARWINAVDDFDLVAICDHDPACAEQAHADFPDVDACSDMQEILVRDDIDLVSVVTPHNTHASIAIDCLNSGKHVVVDKPMSITVAEADRMISAADNAKRTLAVFHNRRHDGNVRAIRNVIQSGTMGDVFHIELSECSYRRPAGEWRSGKETSGGLFYDWGSHAIDWVLHLVPSKVVQVTGFSHKLVWLDVSNEDQVQAIIRFENGTIADITRSTIAYASKPLWRILGTAGAITDTGVDAIKGYIHELNGPPGGTFTLTTSAGEKAIEYMESDWATHYAELADHLKGRGPVPVSAHDGRRVIAIIEAAQRSARTGRSESVAYE